MSITSANAVLSLSVATIFPTPQILQQFASDDVYDIPSIKSVETSMGVDGVLSAGFVFASIPITYMFQANSPSCKLFDLWWTQMQQARETYEASGQIRLPGIQTKFSLIKGSLTGYKPAPSLKKTMQPRPFEITWERMVPAPT